ncbi:hypothetical protein [Streptomyces sp. NBC_00009]|uniref:hypothetical protein n=1 Tax=Streptomyces sp. NBC_00009 TaxID=2975620 RepID=UPI003253DBD5
MTGQQPAPFTAHLDPQHRDRVFRRIVLRTVPFITVVYVIAWMDRVNVGFAKLTMLDDLSWSETVYGATSTSCSSCRAPSRPDCNWGSVTAR